MILRRNTGILGGALAMLCATAIAQESGIVEVPPASECPEDYIIEAGDYPARIAEGCGVSLLALLDANPALDANNLLVGRRISIPGGTPTEGEPRSECGPNYAVDQGDTPARIAAICDVNLSDLIEANAGLEATALTVGQTLAIPGPAIGTETRALPVVDPPYAPGRACSFLETSAAVQSRGIVVQGSAGSILDLNTAALLAFLGQSELGIEELSRSFGQPSPLLSLAVPSDLRALTPREQPFSVSISGDDLALGDPRLADWQQSVLERAMAAITASVNWDVGAEPVQRSHQLVQERQSGCDPLNVLNATVSAAQQYWEKEAVKS